MFLTHKIPLQGSLAFLIKSVMKKYNVNNSFFETIYLLLCVSLRVYVYVFVCWFVSVLREVKKNTFKRNKFDSLKSK